MVQPPPRRDSNYSRKDRLYSEKLLPKKGEFRVSKSTLLWFKRIAVVGGAVVAILLVLALIAVVNESNGLPPVENPKLDRDAGLAK